MYGASHHDLSLEFPEFKQRIHALKLASPEFNQLYAEYRELDKPIYRIEAETETPSDGCTEGLKKKMRAPQGPALRHARGGRSRRH